MSSELFLPYFGDDVERVHHLGTAHVQKHHRHDRSGRKTYAFNTLGYRGPEFDPTAERFVFVFGESNAFGSGVEFEESWPLQFTRLWAEQRGVDPSRVCVMNFAEGGASNDYIARMVISQCAAMRPDLMLVNFAEIHRVEGFVGARPYKLGPWLTRSDTREQVEAMAPSALRDTLIERLRRAGGYYEFHSRETGIAATLRNVLLVQHYAASRGIQAFATCNDAHELRSIRKTETGAAIRRLGDQVDRRFLSDFTITQIPGRKVPREPSVDGIHLGPLRHRVFGEAMHDFANQYDPRAADANTPR